MRFNLAPLLRFLSNKDGPIGMLFGGIVVGIGVMLAIYPYANIPKKVESNTETIQKVKQKNKKQSQKIREVDSEVNTISRRQKIQICNDKDISEKYKQEIECNKL